MYLFQAFSFEVCELVSEDWWVFSPFALQYASKLSLIFWLHKAKGIPHRCISASIDFFLNPFWRSSVWTFFHRIMFDNRSPPCVLKHDSVVSELMPPARIVFLWPQHGHDCCRCVCSGAFVCSASVWTFVAQVGCYWISTIPLSCAISPVFTNKYCDVCIMIFPIFSVAHLSELLLWATMCIWIGKSCKCHEKLSDTET